MVCLTYVIHHSKTSEMVSKWNKSHCSYLIRIEVWLRLAQPEQEGFGIPAERLSGGQKIRATDVQTDPLGGSVVEGLFRTRSRAVVAADLAVSLGHPALGVPLKRVTVTNRRRRETPLTFVFRLKTLKSHGLCCYLRHLDPF